MHFFANATALNIGLTITQKLEVSVYPVKFFYLFRYSADSYLRIAFYFNFRRSILGKLKLDKTDLRFVPHLNFIATPLLPCGPADGAVQKFTGNDEPGPAGDDMTKAVHAFAHFVMLYSHEHVVFCDLQGKR